MDSPEPVHTRALDAALEVYLLGLVDFDAALFLQERLMMDVAQGDDGRGVLLVCEHPPLITIGREGSRADLCCEREDLIARQIEVRWLNRGGGTLVHLPGQLALYPILPLAVRRMNLVDYRERLELAVLDACRELRVRAWRRSSRAGVFCRGGKVANIGVAVRSSVSSHGLFVNINPRTDALSLVCSGDRPASSLASEHALPVAMSAARESLIRRLAARLEFPRYHLYTGHPLLRRTHRVVAYA
jgi:lipoate-protein ligase B